MLIEKIENKSALVVVVGMGYVGLPLAVGNARTGYRVIGIEHNPVKLGKINRGENYIVDVDNDEFKNLVVEKKRLSGTEDFGVIRDADIVIICVPTPLSKNKEPDISYIQLSIEEISKYIHKDMLIIVESTTYPGTTEEVILPRLKESRLEAGKDFYLAFSPERVDPGNKKFKVDNTSKIVGGMTERCLDIARKFYQQSINRIIPVSSPRVAEMTKVFENIFRSVNIALVNELVMLCERMKIDVYEVIDAAASKDFGFMPFYPGPGIGGHCIPLDPYYLAWKSREYDIHTKFIELAGEINENMPYFVVNKLSKILNINSKCLRGADILLLGVAYKKDIDDMRESPALKIIEILERHKADISYHDPYVDEFYIEDRYYKSVELTDKALESADCVIIVTDHTLFDYDYIVDKAMVIFDTRNGTKHITNKREKIIRLSD